MRKHILVFIKRINMKVLLIITLIILCTIAYSQDSLTAWHTIRGLVGVSDTAWDEGQFHEVNDTALVPKQYERIEVQYRSNGAVIQQRQRYYFKPKK